MTIQTPNPTQQQRSARKKRALTAGAVAACLAVGSIGIGALTTLNTTIADNSAEVTTHEVLEMALSGSPFALAVGPDGVTGNTATSWTMTNSGDLAAAWDGILQLQGGADISPEVAAATRLSATLRIPFPGYPMNVDFDLGTMANPVALSEARPSGGLTGVTFSGTLGSGLSVYIPGPNMTVALGDNTPLRLAAGGQFTFTVTPSIDDPAALREVLDPQAVGGVTARALADFVATYMRAS